jgi:excisionase family DNA binding protein
MEGGMTETTATKAERPLRVDQVAKRLGCDESTVRRLCAAGELPGAIQFKAGGRWRVPHEAVAVFIARRRAVPA